MIRLFSLLLFCITSTGVIAQSIPLNSWQSHFNYQSGQLIEKAGDAFYSASYNGLFQISISDKSVKVLSKVEGLNDVGISSMAFVPTLNVLLVAYRNGNIDLISIDENSITVENWPELLRSETLPANRSVHHIRIRDGIAYLTTGFGVVVFDIERREVKELYRYIGAGGQEVAVSGIAFSSDRIYLATSVGILSASLDATVNRQYYGNWTTVPSRLIASSVAYFNGQLYAGFSSYGISKFESATWLTVVPSTSNSIDLEVDSQHLIGTLDDRVVVLDQSGKSTNYAGSGFPKPRQAKLDDVGSVWIADNQNGLVTNHGTSNDVSPVSGDTSIAVRMDSTIQDHLGVTWTRLPDYLGGGILVSNSAGRQRYLSTASGNGGLPSMNINSIVPDKEGNIWFASDRGVGYFWPDGIFTTSQVNAVLPVYGQRRLFSNERCTALAVESGNRKWIASATGLYLFNAEGSELIRQFTTENSRIPSATITTLRFEDESGLLYVDSPNGMVSYRSDASISEEKLSKITIFPNPVRPEYQGWVGIKGLVENSVVKITELSGRLVHETRSQGGTASWNMNDYTGRRARGGIYLILVVAPDGSERLEGKLAIIE
jgi:ligand-binding sensor domain-containing protein